MGAPGRPGRLRGPSPASAVRRNAQAGQPGRGGDQQSVDLADGRAVRRARRADQGHDVQRIARLVGTGQAVGHLRHPRPGGSDRAGRPGSGDDGGPGHGQGGLRHRPAPATGRRSGDPVRAPLPGTAPPDLGVAARRGRIRVHPHRHRRERRRRTVMSAVPVNRNPGTAAGDTAGGLAPADETAIAAGVRSRARRRKTLLWTARLATLVIIVGGWQLLADAKVIDPFFWGKPSGIVTQLKEWVRNGTAYGSIWLQIWTTFKEAVLGFVVGVVAGVIVGVLLGQVRFLAEGASPYIQIAHAVPRTVLGSLS